MVQRGCRFLDGNSAVSGERLGAHRRGGRAPLVPGTPECQDREKDEGKQYESYTEPGPLAKVLCQADVHHK